MVQIFGTLVQDGWESSGGFGSNPAASYYGSNNLYHHFMRFDPVALPSNATVLTIDASTEIVYDVTSLNNGGTTGATLIANDIDDASAAITAGNAPSTWTAVAATTALPDAPSVGLLTVDVSGQVEDIHGRAGWAINGGMVFACFENGGSGGSAYVNIDSDTNPATLEVNYTVTGIGIPLAMHHYKQMRGA